LNETYGITLSGLGPPLVVIYLAADVGSIGGGWLSSTLIKRGWSANLFTLVSDTFPRRAVGSVVGIGGFAGSVAGMLIATVTGYLLQWTGSYVPIFFVAASAYLFALMVIHLLVPRLEPAKLAET